MTFYCWIPILTHALNPSDRDYVPAEFKRVFADLNSQQEVTVDRLIWDDKGLLAGFFVGIPEECSIEVNCNIRNSGLTSFTFTFSEKPEVLKRIERNCAINIFNVIREIYHEHVHHHRNNDATLAPVMAANDQEGVNLILGQYSSKIFKYHKEIKASAKFNPLKKFFGMRQSMLTVESALGEFVYAQSFIDLHNTLIHDPDKIKQCFQRAFDSSNLLREKLSWTLMYIISVAVLLFTVASILPKDFLFNLLFSRCCLK